MLKQRGCKRDQAVRPGRRASQYKGHEAGVHPMRESQGCGWSGAEEQSEEECLMDLMWGQEEGESQMALKFLTWAIGRTSLTEMGKSRFLGVGGRHQEFCFRHDEFVLLDILVETSGRLLDRWALSSGEFVCETLG